MLLLGHVGITLGAAVLLSTIIGEQDSPCARRNEARKSASSSSDTAQVASDSQNHIKSRLSHLLTHRKVKPLIVGSLLPDIIDKPVGLYFLRKTFSSGRIFGHTLLFSALTALAGIYSYRRCRKPQPLYLSFGVITHIILDEMWRRPKTLFWPIRGCKFEKEDTSHWIRKMFCELRTEPEAYIPELIGAAIFLGLVWKKL